MKLTVVILIGAMMQVSAATFGQSLTYNQQNTTLEKVFNEIKKQTGYRVLYADKGINASQKLSVDFKNTPLKEVLEVCLKQQSLAYIIDDQSIVIKEKESSFLERASAVLDGVFQSDVRGRVVGEKNEPLSGAVVIVKGAKSGERTNANGEFVIKAEKGETLVITYVGYKTTNVKVGDDLNITVKMEVSVNELDKVVIQAYGTTSDRLRTGNISTVTAAEIERQPVMNPLLALQGKVPGLIITQTSGYASGNVKTEIRGRTSVNDVPSDPLYIIDGVPLTILDIQNSNYEGGSNGFDQSSISNPAGGQSPIFSLNPSDIESVTVLKDADATAIYGSRGANGVILITTKKGGIQKTQIEGNIYRGVSDALGEWEMMNIAQYLEMRKEAFKNDGREMTTGNAYDILTWDQTRNTDWQEYLWGRTGKALDTRVGIIGGDASNTFRISIGYHDEDAITTATGNDEKFTVHSNLTHRSRNQKFSIGFTNLYSYTSSDMISFTGNATVAPNAPAVFDNLGNLNYKEWDITRTFFPYYNLLNPYNSKTNLLNSSLNINYRIISGMQFSTNLGYSNIASRKSNLYPIVAQNPARNPTGTAQQGLNNANNLIVEPQFTYDFLIGKSKIGALIGGSAQNTKTTVSDISGFGYINDAFLGSIGNAPQKNVNDGAIQYRYAAIFGRINYNLEDTYLLNISVRRDGSSRFGPGKQFGNFGAAGVAWIFSNYNWIKENLNVLSFAKLRASYGVTGSDRVGDYQYLTQWSSNGTLPYNGYPSPLPQQLANDDFHWERNRKAEIALDLRFFNDRISMETAWYRHRSDNQLIGFPLPLMTGFFDVTANSPANVQNKGLEVTLNAKIVDQKALSLSTRFVISQNRNKLLAFPGLEQSVFSSSYIIGQPLSIRRLLHHTGVDAQTGFYTFEDRNGDGAIERRANRANHDLYPVDLTMKYFGSFGADLIWKNFQLNVFFSFKKKLGRNAFNPGSGTPGLVNVNQPIVFLDRWQKPGDVAEYAKYSTAPSDISYTYYGSSDAVYTDASYLRLQNLAISYSLPGILLNKIGISSTRIYSQCQNIFTLTNYKGLDPETTFGFGSLPPQRSLTFGLQLTL